MSTAELAEHLQRPALRRVHPVPLQKDNQLFLGLQDPLMLSGQMMVVPPPAFQVMQLFNGERSLEEICKTIGAPDQQPLQDLVSKLDEFGLLWGPTTPSILAIYRAAGWDVPADSRFPPDHIALEMSFYGWLL